MLNQLVAEGCLVSRHSLNQFSKNENIIIKTEHLERSF